MKKIISVSLVLILVLTFFAGCSGQLSKSKQNQIKSELEFYNKKALQNIDALMFTSILNGEKWIQETFTEDEIGYVPVVNDGTHLGYVSTSGNILLLFSKEGSNSDLIIEPYFDDISSIQWCSEDDIKEVKNQSKYLGSSIGGAPLYGIMAIYGFDEFPELRFWYNTGAENVAYLDYVYSNNEFILVERE